MNIVFFKSSSASWFDGIGDRVFLDSSLLQSTQERPFILVLNIAHEGIEPPYPSLTATYMKTKALMTRTEQQRKVLQRRLALISLPAHIMWFSGETAVMLDGWWLAGVRFLCCVKLGATEEASERDGWRRRCESIGGCLQLASQAVER